MAVTAPAMKDGEGDDGGKKYITSKELTRHNNSGDLWGSASRGRSTTCPSGPRSIPARSPSSGSPEKMPPTDAFIAYHTGTAWRHLDPLFTGFHLKDYHASNVSKDFLRLAVEFSRTGLFEKKGHVAMYALAAVTVLMSFVFYCVLYCESLWVHVAAAVALGLCGLKIPTTSPSTPSTTTRTSNTSASSPSPRSFSRSTSIRPREKSMSS